MIAVTLMPGCHTRSDGAAEITSSGLSGRLTVTGSSTLAPLVVEIAKRFEQLNPGVRIDVQTGGTGKGIADVRSGVADIGMASRPLKGNETDLNAYKIAADGVSLIVHESNPVQELTQRQVVGIYTGKIDNWLQCGGRDQSIQVVHKAEGRATLEVFLKHFQIDNPDVKADVIVGDNQHGIKTVAGAVGALGYVSIGTAEVEAATGTPIRLLPVGGIAATTAKVASGEFPMSRPLNLVTIDLANPLVRTFVEFCQSEEVHDQVVAQYFVPIKK
ncbi:phosphate ABC transporter substrate-binding protein [Stieleria marina]|uniref:phosphate ABC transporter substrate-binding protein n=1 Tax=Stieleria marina TaxID=1930275 RepID=UPI003AF3E856